jgi:hypothetical protein
MKPILTLRAHAGAGVPAAAASAKAAHAGASKIAAIHEFLPGFQALAPHSAAYQHSGHPLSRRADVSCGGELSAARHAAAASE